MTLFVSARLLCLIRSLSNAYCYSFSRDYSGAYCIISPDLIGYRMYQNLSSHKGMNLDLEIIV